MTAWNVTVRHDIQVRGYAFGLRPVHLDDAAFILSLRTDPELSRYINPTSDSLKDQRAWMQRYFARANDYYWIVTRSETKEPEGAVALYNVDYASHLGEWGRWVLRKGSLAAVESASLVYRAAFEVLNLRRIYCRTVLANRSVVSFHASCGLETSVDAGLRVRLRGTDHEVVEQFLTADRWPLVKRVVDERACAVAHLLGR